MIDDWSRTAEQLMLAIVDNKIRVIAVTSPAGAAGVSSVARELAATFARAGRKTLLVDLSGAAADTAEATPQMPAQALAGEPVLSNETGLASLKITPTPEARPRYANPDLLRNAFDGQLAAYSAIVLDLPPVGLEPDDTINPVAVARAADAVFLVAPTGATLRDDLSAAAQTLRQVGAPLAGVIMNDRSCRTLGEEIAATATERLAPYAPRLADRIVAGALASRYLNRHFLIAS